MKRIIVRIFFILLTLAQISFIFSNSLMPPAESTDSSTSVMSFIQDILDRLGTGIVLTDHIVRKTAHFIEFTALGVLLLWTLSLYTRKVGKYGFIVLSIGAAVAICDETIQRFVPGRSAQISDAALDLSGVAAGSLIAGFIFCYFFRRGKYEKAKGHDHYRHKA